jgi:hypothetical protein
MKAMGAVRERPSQLHPTSHRVCLKELHVRFSRGALRVALGVRERELASVCHELCELD